MFKYLTEKQKKREQKRKRVDLNSNVTKITYIYVNGLYIHQLKDWQSGLKNYDPTVCCLQETHFKCNDIGRVKVYKQKKKTIWNREGH